MILYVHDPGKNKRVRVGVFNGKTKVFTKTVKSHEFMNIMNGYGIQENAIEQLKELGCETILYNTPTSKRKCSFDEWLDKGKVRNFGHGRQWFLDIYWMEEL